MDKAVINFKCLAQRGSAVVAAGDHQILMANLLNTTTAAPLTPAARSTRKFT
jgi:hypothetical protein